jgi:toxin ParE1/3/4
MSLPIVFRRKAEDELDDAAEWYNQRRPGLGEVLRRRVQEALDRIAEMPAMHEVVREDVRRAPVDQFPYSIIYRVERNRVVVIAVFHTSRDPAGWMDRR